MNKYERAEIKQIMLTQIDLLIEKRLTEKQLTEIEPHHKALADELRLERLTTALRRIDGDNFGACFKCDKPIGLDRLRIRPESVICTDCLE